MSRVMLPRLGAGGKGGDVSDAPLGLVPCRGPDRGLTPTATLRCPSGPGRSQGVSPEGALASLSLVVLGHGFQPWLGSVPQPIPGRFSILLVDWLEPGDG